MAENSDKLPFLLDAYDSTKETVGSKVLLSSNPEKLVIKISKDSYPTGSFGAIRRLLEGAFNFRDQEEITHSLVKPPVADAVVKQDYLIVEGEKPGTANLARVQQRVEGTTLRELGFNQIMDLEVGQLQTLKDLIVASMKSYLKTGYNFDLSGSDERDSIKKSRILNLRRLIFPLRTSNNLMVTDAGIKLIDPNIMGTPGSKRTLKKKILQMILFFSSATDYLLLNWKISQKPKSTSKLSG